MNTKATSSNRVFVQAGLVAILIASSLFPRTAQAESVQVTYQGLVQSGGTNFNGAGQFKFALVTSTNTSRHATATAIMGGVAPNRFVSSCIVNDGGSGYTGSVSVTFSGGGGSGATAIANVTGGVVTSITVLTPGSGYSTAPVATVALPPDNILFETYWSNDGTSSNGSEPSAAVNVPVQGGLFTVKLGDTALANMTTLDSTVFSQPKLKLRIWFNDGVNGFAALSPVQPLTHTPYAVRANNLDGTLPASQLTGTIPPGQLSGVYSGAVTFNNSSNSFTGVLNGNGAGVTNVKADALSFTSTNLSIVSWGLEDNPEFPVGVIPSGLDDVVAAAAGLAHSLALKSNGMVVGWGGGQTNDPGTLNSGQSIVPPGLSNVVAVSAGFVHSLALRNNGTIIAWGAGLTNDPASTYDHGQSIVPPGLSNVAAIAAAYMHNLALRSNGTVVAWGAGLTNIVTNSLDFGQSIIPAGLSNVVAVGGGIAHSLALRSNGSVVGWGAGGPGPGATNQFDFGQSTVPAGLSNVIAIAAGGVHSLALKTDGTVVAWGAGLTNDPGSGAHFGQSIVPPGLSNVVAIVAGYVHSVALKSDGTIVAWGASSESGVGYGQAEVPPGLNNVVALGSSSMALHSIALRKRSSAPVAWLDSDNTFNGNVTVNGDVKVSGELRAGGSLRLDDANLWLRAGSDIKNGLGWYGDEKQFGPFFQFPDGPVLFGASGGALATSSTNGQKIALSWDTSQHIGIGDRPSADAKLWLGSEQAATKVGFSGAGIGYTNSQFRLHLPNSGASFAFLDSQNGNRLLTIQGFNGNVGLGTPTPASKLDVRGDIRLGPSGQFYAPSSGENLRIVRGVVNAAGTILAGQGFTVTKGPTGFFTLTFSPTFSDTPAVTVTAQSGIDRISTCTSVSSSSAGIWTRDSAGTATDNQFNFIAIGQR